MRSDAAERSSSPPRAAEEVPVLPPALPFDPVRRSPWLPLRGMDSHPCEGDLPSDVFFPLCVWE